MSFSTNNFKIRLSYANYVMWIKVHVQQYIKIYMILLKPLYIPWLWQVYDGQFGLCSITHTHSKCDTQCTIYNEFEWDLMIFLVTVQF